VVDEFNDSLQDDREVDESSNVMNKKAKEDLKFMKETFKVEQKNKTGNTNNEYYDFQEKNQHHSC